MKVKTEERNRSQGLHP